MFSSLQQESPFGPLAAWVRVKIPTASAQISPIKGIMSRDLNPFFKKKILPEPHMNRKKRFSDIYHFREEMW